MRQVNLYTEEGKLIYSCPSFPGLTNSFKTAREHKGGYGVVLTEKKVYVDGHRDYVWEMVVFHNGEEIYRQDNIDGLEIPDFEKNFMANVNER